MPNIVDAPRALGLCLASAPLIQPDEFIGRAGEIDAIHHILQPDQATSQQRRVALGGIGGIGKTQLAIAYANRHECSYTSVLWLNATSELSLHTSLRSVARGLIAAGELERLDNNQVLARVQEWLSHPYNRQWLLIFDNYDDPDQFDINVFYPNIGYGSVIVTTRLPNHVHGFHLVPIQSLTAIEDSIDILRIRSGRDIAYRGKASIL